MPSGVATSTRQGRSAEAVAAAPRPAFHPSAEQVRQQATALRGGKTARRGNLELPGGSGAPRAAAIRKSRPRRTKRSGAPRAAQDGEGRRRSRDGGRTEGRRQAGSARRRPWPSASACLYVFIFTRLCGKSIVMSRFQTNVRRQQLAIRLPGAASRSASSVPCAKTGPGSGLAGFTLPEMLVVICASPSCQDDRERVGLRASAPPDELPE